MVKLPVFTDIDLRNLKTPVLAIVGARDVLLDSAQTKRRLERHSPNVQVVYLPDAGHLIANQTLGILEFMQAQIREDGEMAGRGATTAEAGITLKATSSRSLSPPA